MKNKFALYLIMALMILLISACSSEPVNSGGEDKGAQEEALTKVMESSEFPVVDGDITMLTLAEQLRCALTGESLAQVHQNIIFNGVELGWEGFANSNVQILLLAGDSAEITQTASEYGIQAEVIPIAKEYYVFYTNNGTEAGDITSEQAKMVIDRTSSTNTRVALGYYMSGYPSEDTSICTVDGIEANSETVQSGEYPFIINYFAVIRQDSPQGSSQRAAVEALISDGGQRLIKEAGYEEL